MSERRSSAYALLAVVTAVVAVAGFGGYVLYPRFDLPSVSGAGLLALAAGAGVASFFSPCSFPLLASMLARPTAQAAQRTGRRPIGPALVFAAGLSAGAAGFLALAGGAVALGGGALFEDVTFTSTAGRIIRALVGSALIVLGLVQLGVLAVNLRRYEPALHDVLRRQASLRRRRPLAGFTLFGFVYLLAGFG
jgi:cytochrome c-type biogenesis protein